jgi:N-acyl amino acid synthase of PEP-CTERM/exosortase system
LSTEKRFFDSNFEVILADTQESRQINYNLRYQVYCDEMGFEDVDKFPDQMEMDEWDCNSVHILVRHKFTGHWLGGLRLVMPESPKFPFEGWSKLDNDVTSAERACSVEVSRLCIIKEARRFTAKRFAPYGLPDQEVDEGNVRSIFNFKNQSRSLMWGLIRAAAVFCESEGISHWYFIVAPSLAGFIRKHGFDMPQIGEPCEYRGLRIPYRLNVANILANPLWSEDYKTNFYRYSELVEESAEKLRVYR